MTGQTGCRARASQEPYVSDGLSVEVCDLCHTFLHDWRAKKPMHVRNSLYALEEISRICERFSYAKLAQNRLPRATI